MGGVGVLNELLLLEIVVQVGVGQGVGEVLHDLVDTLPDIVPAPFGVAVGVLGQGGLVGLEVGLGHEDLVVHDVLSQLRHDVLAVVLDGGEPAEVVQSEVIVDDLLLVFDAHGGGHHVDDGDGHVADVDDPGVGPQAATGLGDDGGRVGVVEDPVVGPGVLGGIVNDLDHGENGPHAVGHAAGTAGLLPHTAVAEGDLLVLLPHGVLAHPHLGEDEGGAGVGGLHIGGDRELDVAFQILVKDPVHQDPHLVLTLLVDVEQADLVHLQLLPAQGDGLDDAGGKGAAASNNGNDHGDAFLSVNFLGQLIFRQPNPSSPEPRPRSGARRPPQDRRRSGCRCPCGRCPWAWWC